MAAAVDTVAKATVIIKEVVSGTAPDPKELDRATATPVAMATVVVTNNPKDTIINNTDSFVFMYPP